VLRACDWEELGLGVHQQKALRAIMHCRTAALGGHVDACDSCGSLRISYNSCRNRHCPKCQGHRREEWIRQRQSELLPCPYFHVVFTLPQEINPLALRYTTLVYKSLFEAAWDTLRQFASRLGVQPGMVAVLHTWGQNLSLHPHLHCIVPGGGIRGDGLWQRLSHNGKYLFPVRALSKVFRAKYVQCLRTHGVADKPLLESLFKKDWVVYAKRPFGGPGQVIEYLGRYTHKVAISNHRILDVSEDGVGFAYKDYRKGGQKRQMRLSPTEFVRRFAQHILPRRFVRIRHYGILSSSWKRGRLQGLQQQLFRSRKPPDAPPPLLHRRCPCCKEGRLVTILTFGKRGPPVANLLGGCQLPVS
jgi:hypothetical protein